MRHWRPGRRAAEHGDGVGEPADQRGAVVDAQQVVEDLGVAAVVRSSISRSSVACWWTMAWTRRAMLTKERCAESRRISSAVDGLEHRAQHRLVLGRCVERVEHILGELALAQPLHHLGQQLAGEACGLGLLPREHGLALGEPVVSAASRRPLRAASAQATATMATAPTPIQTTGVRAEPETRAAATATATAVATTGRSHTKEAAVRGLPVEVSCRTISTLKPSNWKDHMTTVGKHIRLP